MLKTQNKKNKLRYNYGSKNIFLFAHFLSYSTVDTSFIHSMQNYSTDFDFWGFFTKHSRGINVHMSGHITLT